MHSFTLCRMRSPKVSDISGIINKKFPFALAEDWDNVGLQLGDPSATVSKIMVALDPLPVVIHEAIEHCCDLLITHHPLIFSPLRTITSASTTGSSILKAIRSNLALIAMHTNYDIADNGLNDLLAGRVGVTQTSPLKIIGREELAKLVVYVPVDHLELVRTVLLPYVNSIGRYRDCSFTSSGEGTFLPLEGAQPMIGSVGRFERVHEQRLELLIRRSRIPQAVKALREVHPYEEPAFDCYPVLNESSAYGLGRVGKLAEPLAASQFAEMAGGRLGCSHLRLVGDPKRLVSKVALCSGSGVSLLRDAVRAGADLLLTGDVKYHDAREAEAHGILLLDAGHYSTEQIMANEICRFLDDSLLQAGYQVNVMTACCENDPFIPVTPR